MMGKSGELDSEHGRERLTWLALSLAGSEPDWGLASLAEERPIGPARCLRR